MKTEYERSPAFAKGDENLLGIVSACNPAVGTVEFSEYTTIDPFTLESSKMIDKSLRMVFRNPHHVFFFPPVFDGVDSFEDFLARYNYSYRFHLLVLREAYKAVKVDSELSLSIRRLSDRLDTRMARPDVEKSFSFWVSRGYLPGTGGIRVSSRMEEFARSLYESTGYAEKSF